MQAEVTDLVEEEGTCDGRPRRKCLTARSRCSADLVVGADGRHSAVRDLAGLEVEDLGAPMDVLWFRLSKQPEDGSAGARPHPGRAPCSSCSTAAIIGNAPSSSRKAASTDLRRRGLPAFRAGHRRAQSGTRRSRAGDRLLGRREAADRTRRPPEALVPAGRCSASATRPMPCRRSAASASISPSRTRSPRPIFLPSR